MRLSTRSSPLEKPGRISAPALSQVERTMDTTTPMAMPIRQENRVISSVVPRPLSSMRQRFLVIKLSTNSLFIPANQAAMRLHSWDSA